MNRRRVARAAALCLVLGSAYAVSARQYGIAPQAPFGPDPLGRFPRPVASAPGSGLPSSYDGRYQFCRLRFRNSVDGDGSGWFVDYPRADLNVSSRLGELTKVPVSVDRKGKPQPVVVTLTDPVLFTCPMIVMTEPGGVYFDELEAEQLRTYLLKGGFLWADDSWGSYAWEWWTEELSKALPRSEYPIIDLTTEHPLFHTLFDIARVQQIPNVGLWVTRHLTAERGADSPETPPRAILEPRTNRIMVFMTHNTDFGDAFEEEAVSPDYFRNHSVQAYAIAANLILYALTH